MAEKKTTISDNAEILTEANIKKEFNAIRRMFKSIKDDDADKMKLIERIIEEVAFQKVAIFQSTLPRRERPSKITYFFSNIDFYLGNTNKLQYCSFHFTILLIIFLLLSMVRTPLPFYVRLPPAPAYIIRIPSAS